MPTRIRIRRSRVMPVSRSQSVSGRAMSPTSPASSRRRSNSSRTGGGCGRSPANASALAMAVGLLLLDAVGEQHPMDALLEGLKGGAADATVTVVMGIDLGLDLAGMG